MTKAIEPAIKEFLTTATNLPPPTRKKSGGGIIKRLWDAMLGAEKETGAPIAPISPEQKKPIADSTPTPAPTTPTGQPRHKRHRNRVGSGPDQRRRHSGGGEYQGQRRNPRSGNVYKKPEETSWPKVKPREEQLPFDEPLTIPQPIEPEEPVILPQHQETQPIAPAPEMIQPPRKLKKFLVNYNK